ncbi:DUF4249 domain-containing protein [Segetibacter sp.]|jgi:hypothetical protein|uniref:DUF4249 domain-containing protein n=1 Tax=Segetibacter sp. TaxID=2231182 RepID=UPI002621D2AC|nr:DUF4249 domain-containing protein [Segetibacter sp.]MCW3081818.1 hypothetical protein [Segetibacter sp.]
MLSRWTILFTLAVLLVCTGCIKQIDVETRNQKPVLVIEGSITTDTVPYTVRLSYSGPFTRGNVIPDEFLEKQANVAISDHLGNEVSLVHKGDGIYETTDPSYIGTVGRSYRVTVTLKNGKAYTSVPEKIAAAVPITNISTGFNFFTPSGINVYAGVDDAANQENYYQWLFYAWAPRKTNGISCGIGCIQYEYCFQKVTHNNLTILSDAAINGNKIRGQFIGVSPIYWFGRHYIDIGQLSTTREAFQFLQRLNEQQNRTGNILDPLPASIKGNVYNVADPNDFALGYFSAAGVTHKRAILIPFSITQFMLDQTAAVFIPRGPKICFEAFPDALIYPPEPSQQNPPPPGWENAEVIEVRW